MRLRKKLVNKKRGAGARTDKSGQDRRDQAAGGRRRERERPGTGGEEDLGVQGKLRDWRKGGQGGGATGGEPGKAIDARVTRDTRVPSDPMEDAELKLENASENLTDGEHEGGIDFRVSGRGNRMNGVLTVREDDGGGELLGELDGPQMQETEADSE